MKLKLEAEQGVWGVEVHEIRHREGLCERRGSKIDLFKASGMEMQLLYPYMLTSVPFNTLGRRHS
jgi:hypothetical protein